MQYHRIPHSSLEVSTLGLGTMTFGEQNSEADAHAQLDYAVAQGINLIDVAEMYPVPPRPETQGLTETYVGNWLAKHGSREKLIIASKVSGPSRNNDKGIRPDQALDRKNIREALHDSLKRLQTDYLDLYQVHWPQRPTNCFGKLGYSWTDSAPAVSLLDTLDALAEYQRAGKIRYIGVSNETAFGVMRYLHLADKHDLPRIVTIQNPYSLLNRSFEVGLAEVSQYEGVELLAYSCLGFGTLTGKYLNGAKPAGARNTLFSRFTRYSGEQTQKAVAAYVDIARRHGLDPAQMALAFVRRQPFVASTLLGATTMAHALELGDKMISINLLPMTLVNEPDAVSFLLDEIKANALVPEQIIVEFTESEVISRFDEFAEAIKSLKAAGISVAIDHFGAGFAGLLLLSRFQPDRIKISQELITNVHKSGPRQAIIQAIIKCCTSLEIQVSAMGVATPEEWMWLESAGIEMFQGDLFAKAKLNGIPSIAWPEKK